MARRKTFEILPFVEACNRALNAPGNSPEWRQGIIAAVEQALTASRSYAGFQNTDPDRQHNEEGYLIPGTYDDSIRAYYVKGEPFSIITAQQRRAA